MAASKTTTLGKAAIVWLLVLLLLSAVSVGLVDADCSWSNSAWRLDSEAWAGERSWIDGGHPDSCFIDLEKISDERIEVDVGVGEIVESKLFPVPKTSQYFSLI